MDNPQPDSQEPVRKQPQSGASSPESLEDQLKDVNSADRLIEEIKRDARIGPRQFPLLTIFWITFLVSILFAMPRLIGVGFGEFFFFLYGASFAFAPFVVWGTVNLSRAVPRRQRWTAGVVMALLIVMPMLGLIAWEEGERGVVEAVQGTVCFWSLQVLCICMVYFLVFRRRPGFAEVLASRVEARRRRREKRDGRAP